MVLKGQLQNLHRAILNIQSMENVFPNELSTYGVNLTEKINEKLALTDSPAGIVIAYPSLCIRVCYHLIRTNLG